MLSIVNGYVCRSGCDEAAARKGHDPRNPTDNPVKKEMLAARDGKLETDAASGATRFRSASDPSKTWLTSPAAGHPPLVVNGLPGGLLDLTV